MKEKESNIELAGFSSVRSGMHFFRTISIAVERASAGLCPIMPLHQLSVHFFGGAAPTPYIVNDVSLVSHLDESKGKIYSSCNLSGCYHRPSVAFI